MSLPLTISRPLSRPVAWLSALFGVLLVTTLGLWAYYGTTVFFETVRAGWAACF
jgi:hypothetical protein